MRLNEEKFFVTIANEIKNLWQIYSWEKKKTHLQQFLYKFLKEKYLEIYAKGIDKSTKLSAEHSRVYNFASFLS